MNCKNCGTRIQSDAAFCSVCGAKNMESTANQAITQSTIVIPQQKKINMGLLIAVIVMAIIIVAGIAALIGYTAGQDNETAQVAVQTTETQTETPTTEPAPTTEAPVTEAPTTAAPATQAPATAAPTTANQQSIPTFTYNGNYYDYSSQYLFDSANEYITRNYLSTCTRDEITIIMNEMYARHGYIFKDAELRDYFNSQTWYYGTTTSMEEAASYFNSIERANLNTIYQYQKDMGWRQ